MHEVLAEKPEDVDPVRTRQLEDIRGHVVFENVTWGTVMLNPLQILRSG
jgi:hypothetical protein